MTIMDQFYSFKGVNRCLGFLDVPDQALSPPDEADVYAEIEDAEDRKAQEADMRQNDVPDKPYEGFPQKPCPACGGSTKEPWRRYPACKLCNP